MQTLISWKLWSTRIPLAHRECATCPVILNFPHLSHQPPPGSIPGLRALRHHLCQVGPGLFSLLLGREGCASLAPHCKPSSHWPSASFWTNYYRHRNNHPLQFCPLKAKEHGWATSPGRTNPLGHSPQRHKRSWYTLTSPGSRQGLQPQLLQPIPFFLWEASGDKMKQQWKW